MHSFVINLQASSKFGPTSTLRADESKTAVFGNFNNCRTIAKILETIRPKIELYGIPVVILHNLVEWLLLFLR